jgi:hypothetical protein
LLGLAFDLNWKDFLEEYMVCQEKTLGSEEHREAMAAYRENVIQNFLEYKFGERVKVGGPNNERFEGNY